MLNLKPYYSSWLQGLKAGVQSNFAVSLGFGTEFVIIKLNKLDVELYQCRGKRLIWSGQIDQRDFDSKLKKLKGDKLLLIPKEDCITLHLSIPKVAEHSIEQLLESEVERKTAFRYDEVKTDHIVLSSEGTQLNLLVYVVPKKKLAALHETATKAGLSPQSLVVQNTENIAEYFGAFMINGTASNRNTPLRTGTALLIFTLFVAAILSPFIERHWSYKKLLAEHERITPLIEQIQLKKRNLDVYEKQVKTINDFANRQTSLLGLLEEVSRVLPDTAWVQRFHLRDNELILQGFASNASEVMAILNGIAMFKSPTLRSPITREPDKEIERFNIALKVVF